jgi:hypothetical protein
MFEIRPCQTLLATRQLCAKNTNGPSNYEPQKTCHDDDNRHLHRTLEFNSVEVPVHVGIDLLQFQADKNVRALDCHQRCQNEYRYHPAVGRPFERRVTELNREKPNLSYRLFQSADISRNRFDLRLVEAVRNRAHDC